MNQPRNDDEEIVRWLALLRDGSEAEQATARTELGLILEARGLVDDAADAYARNVEAGVSDRRPYERLAALARARGDYAEEARVLRLLADVLAPAPEGAPQPPDVERAEVVVSAVADEAERPVDEVAVSEGAMIRARTDEDTTSTIQVSTTSEPPAPDLLTEPFAAPRVASEPKSTGSRPQEDDDPGVALHHVLEMHPEDLHHHVEQRPARRARTGIGRTLALLAMLVPIVVVIGAVLMWQGGADLLPSAEPAASPTDLLVGSPQPTVEMRLIASTLVPLASPAAPPVPSPTLPPTATPTPLPARCSDAETRFPETRDAEAAVRDAYRLYLSRQGVSRDGSSTLFASLGDAYAARSSEVVAGWIAVTLQREQRGLPSFPLADYVASDVIVATGPNEYQLRATISPQGWTEIRAWPAETCEGAFMRSPANAHWVDLMQASVGDITWALPTPRPSR